MGRKIFSEKNKNKNAALFEIARVKRFIMCGSITPCSHTSGHKTNWILLSAA